MGKKIIVAGLGHGGIAAAGLLAEKGYDVTVYEKKAEGTLGYDWTDIFAPNALKIAGMDMPPEDKFEYKENMTFFGPSGTKGLKQHVPEDNLEIKMERRDIYDHFIKSAVAKGAKIVYDCEVYAPILLGNRVVGIKTKKGDFYGDLVVDACGMNSPVRRNLPEHLGIENEVARDEKITIFRAFFNKACDDPVEDKFKVMLFPYGQKALCWVAAEEDHTDLLYGRFEDYDRKDLDDMIENVRRDNPRLGTEIVRGGQFVEIPVRQPLSIMVSDGYAAIGDSAFMTVPLIGSGIANALKASRILADTVIADKNDEFTANTLWDYQVNYYKQVGAGLAPLATARKMLLGLDAKEIDYCFESGMITEDDITIGADFGSLDGLVGFDPKDLSNKANKICKEPALLKKIIAGGTQMGRVAAACALMPKKWNRQRVLSWAKVYSYSFK